jgi:hypothetical protein
MTDARPGLAFAKASSKAFIISVTTMTMHAAIAARFFNGRRLRSRGAS